RYGGPEVLKRVDAPTPVPQPGEVLIRLEYSGINFMDVHTRQGKYDGSRTYPVSLPATLGIEGAGTIADVAGDVTDFRVGDRVAYCLHWSSYAEFAAVPAWKVVKVPQAIPLQMAAASLFH